MDGVRLTSLDRMTAASFSSPGTCPVLAALFQSPHTWWGRRSPYLLSALHRAYLMPGKGGYGLHGMDR